MQLELEIHDLSRGGNGVGRDASGRVVFVPFTAPGDRVRVEITSEEKNFAEARLLEVLRGSPERVPPPCPVFTRCGGCEWQHLPYARQWQTKKGGVSHALARVGVTTDGVPWEEFPADQIWEYRNRVQLRGEGERLGFYARRSQEIVSVERCYIARPELNALLPKIREEGRARPREYKVELEVYPDGETTASWNARHSAQGFRQVHDAQNEKLQGWVRTHLTAGEMLLDLYGGSGNLSRQIAEKFHAVQCVDVGAPSPAPEGTPAHFEFHRAPVRPWLEKNLGRLSAAGSIDVILDPPREGLGTELGQIIDALVKLPVRKVLAVGCEADSWSRIVHRLGKRGWTLHSLGALDFFPQTHHVEALAVLERTETQR